MPNFDKFHLDLTSPERFSILNNESRDFASEYHDVHGPQSKPCKGMTALPEFVGEKKTYIVCNAH